MIIKLTRTGRMISVQYLLYYHAQFLFPFNERIDNLPAAASTPHFLLDIFHSYESISSLIHFIQELISWFLPSLTRTEQFDITMKFDHFEEHTRVNESSRKHSVGGIQFSAQRVDGFIVPAWETNVRDRKYIHNFTLCKNLPLLASSIQLQLFIENNKID